MTNVDPKLAKVLFPLENGKAETLWAVPLGRDLYRLDNTPWLCYGISWQDVIKAVPTDPHSIPVFCQVVKKSGNRTLRFVFPSTPVPSTESQQTLDGLIEMGCSYEGANQKYIGVNVPPSVDLNTVCDFLTQAPVQWEHADPTYEQLHPAPWLSSDREAEA